MGRCHIHPIAMPRSNRSLVKTDFEALSEFRYQMRRFERFSEDAARAEGITPLQYLLLLHLKGFPGRPWATVGDLAHRLQIMPHSAVAQRPPTCLRASVTIQQIGPSAYS